MDPLQIHRPALAVQHHVDSPISESWVRARRLISRTRGGSSDRRFRSYRKVDRDRPITRPALLCEISYRSARYPATARCWSGVTTFFGDILEHLFIQEQLGHEPLEPLDLDFKLAAPAIGIDLRGVMPLPPAMVGGLGDADLAADVRDGQSLGQVAVGVLQQTSHFSSAVSCHGSPRFKFTEALPLGRFPKCGGGSRVSIA